MDNIGITRVCLASKLYGMSTPVNIESGSTICTLPTAIFNALVADFPTAVFDPSSGLYTVDCAQMAQHGTVDFVFGATTIKVPYSEIIWQSSTNNCVLGITASTGNHFILGGM